MSKSHQISAPVIFGEVLFDCFDNGESILGGAPFNVAWHLQALGAAPLMVTRVGDDARGTTIRLSMDDWNMQTSAVQTDTDLPTGYVNIRMENGEPIYEIANPVAYDDIREEDLPWHIKPQLFYHGSLALRSDVSRKTFQKLCSENPAPIFVDINLRDPWWRKDQVLNMVHSADWVKLNQDELHRITGDSGYAIDTAHDWINNHDLEGVIVTNGAEGAKVITSSTVYTAPPPKIDCVIDTVGAGDAFSSVFILGLLKQWDLQTTLERAQIFAATIVQQRGATAENPALYLPFAEDWLLE